MALRKIIVAFLTFQPDTGFTPMALYKTKRSKVAMKQAIVRMPEALLIASQETAKRKEKTSFSEFVRRAIVARIEVLSGKGK